jgi:Histidine kinase-like ATPase domain
MPDSRLPDLAAGGACAWQLPPDESGPAMARSLLAATMTTLGLDCEVIEDGKLAVSETSTNALRHGRPRPGPGQVVPPELWIWARTAPAPQLVVSVFDTNHQTTCKPADADLMAENGRGLGIVDAVCAGWGIRRSRSRLTPLPIPGKAAWFALPLPEPWPAQHQAISPGRAAHQLAATLAARGVNGTRRSDDRGISIIEIPGIDVWIEPKNYTWQDTPSAYIIHPLADLHETADDLIHRIESCSRSR